MFSTNGTKAALAAEPSVTEPPLRIHPHAKGLPEPPISPSIERVADEEINGYELKFLVTPEGAQHIQQWAAKRMEPDARADAQQQGAYQSTTLYLDTPQRDVFHRAAGHRRRKFRLRRYGLEERGYLERETRRGDRVATRRSDVPLVELAWLNGAAPPDSWAGEWFRCRVADRGLQPACRLTYDRTAFVLRTDDGPLGLTLDRCIRGLSTADWDLTPVGDEHGILTEQVICELKFRGALPNVFKELITAEKLQAGGFSKYRRAMLAIGQRPGCSAGERSPAKGLVTHEGRSDA